MRGCDVSKGLQVYKINDVFLFHEVTFALSDNLPHAQTGSPWRDSGKRAKVGLFKDWTGKLQAPLPLRGQADGLGQVHGEKGKSGKQDCRLHCDKVGQIMDSNQIRTKSIK